MNRLVARTACSTALLSLFAASSCNTGSDSGSTNRGDFAVSVVSTGLTQIYPYRIRQSDSNGNPTGTVVNIESIDTLHQNVGPNNGVLPVGTFGTTATLPSGAPGNQFLLVRFTHDLIGINSFSGLESILSNSAAAGTSSGLTTALSLIAYDPFTETSTALEGRGFVGGYTYFGIGGAPVLAAQASGNGVAVVDPRAAGFPRGFSSDVDLVSRKSFVFVADTDGDLTTLETFPKDRLIRIVVTGAVRNSDNKILPHEVCTATTVGPDPNPPDVLGAVSSGALSISPGNGAVGVDPTTTLLVQFNKPVQPHEVGVFYSANDLVPASGGVTLSVVSAANAFDVIYYADPLGFGDFCNYRITPAYNLPGSPPAPQPPTQVQVTVTADNVHGLSGQNLGRTVATDFTTGTGPGLVNAPVAPEAIYVGMGGAHPGVAVLDLNGFGKGSGDPKDTRANLNPNMGAPGVDPPIAPGTSSLDAGSRGVFTLTRDTAGNERLLSDPLVGQIGDIHIGAPLDLVFNNENINRNARSSNQHNPIQQVVQPGNTISIAPHPNPPRLVFPPPNPARAIFGEEPTKTTSNGAGVVSVTVPSPPCQGSPINLLARGDPRAPANNPASLGLFDALMPNQFYGPQPPPASPPPPTPFCRFMSRQQVGHFLYVLDRDAGQILVVNSNRMTVLDTIRTSDPYDLAMAPNLRTLAVSNFASSTVSFIDIDPLSASFHQVVGETRVEAGPTSIVWQPDGEVLLVINTGANTASIINPLDFSVTKTVSGFLNQPVDAVLTPRYAATGHASGVYFGYIINADGTIAVYESGPDGVNGIGFQDIIGTVPGEVFRRPRKIVLDPSSEVGAVFIAHVDDTNVGQVSRLELTSSPTGQLPINQFQNGLIIPPTFRQKQWTVLQRFGGRDPSLPGKDQFSGNAIVDIAFDEILNAGASRDQATPFSSAFPEPSFGHSSKGFIKLQFPTLRGFAPYFPRFLFAAVADRSRIDVMDLDSGRKIASIDTEGTPRVLAQYWRY